MGKKFKVAGIKALIYFGLLFFCYLWITNLTMVYYPDVDARVFEFIGKAWTQGTVPYSYYFDHKGPVVFGFFALSYLIDGTRHGVAVMWSIWMALSICLTEEFVVRLNLVKSKIPNTIFSYFLSTFIVMVFYSITGTASVVIGDIVMPFVILMALIYQTWVIKGNFLETKGVHYLYGFLCMTVILARASDAIFVFLLYAIYWFQTLFVSKKYKECLVRFFLTVAGGFTPFAIALAYFGHYGCVNQFMFSTFLVNFRYHVPPDPDLPPSKLIITMFIALIGICITIFVTRKKEEKPLLVAPLFAFMIHMAFWYGTAKFEQYCVCYIADFLCFAFVCTVVFMKMTENQYLLKKHVAMISSAIILTLCGGVWYAKANLTQLQSFYDMVAVENNRLADEIIASGDSVLVLDNSELVMALMDRGYMNPCKYFNNQWWDIQCNLATEDDIVNAILESSPDYLYESGHYERDHEHVVPGYRMTSSIDLSVKMLKDNHLEEYADQNTGYVYYIYEKEW